jgi:hypothetical protein
MKLLKNICAIFALFFVSIVSAKEVLDVLVVYDTNTISSVSLLDSEQERKDYANTVVARMNKSFVDSGLGNVIQFQLKNQVTQAYTGYFNGQRENLVHIRERYQPFFNYVKDNRKPMGALYFLQKQYNADVVIGIFKQGPILPNEPELCGIAVNIPNKTFLGGNYTNLSQLNQSAAFSVFFIDTDSDCLDPPYIPAHEFGHTAGLRHGVVTDLAEYHNYRPNMLRDDSTGYYVGNKNYQTLMSGKDLHLIQNINRFSDFSKSNCGNQADGPCGSALSSSVETLKIYASDYNKRGNWMN